jgi:hypothetical protein
MHQGMKLAPAVVVRVEKKCFREEEQDVREEGWGEDVHQVVRELRIQDDQHEEQACTEGRGEREGDGEQLRKLVREPVVSRIFRLVADRLDDQREDGDGKDERREQQVKLRDRPDGHAASNDGKPSVLSLHVGLRAGRSFRSGSLVGQSRRAGGWVRGRGRRPVGISVLAAHQ